ncbi:SDR family NAD(P)-dependent oxidoreductase [Neolewinella antarctica]|uniref:NAD(P)-dependent dehydrogenase (Short-subunit alcohol dehydrogenase family) n=1 Tax=Neolewinella antarctica TaxID=442734 RepID=A0ABX0XF19_9BACT|nr:SDR family oxidoreductase [Neolewinella antarctica]NJC27926.1 NAD(P)-dependent dehydrogenase (short-subunit alcohol dehydrogenase family) [Neolewinella antarctica]
MKHILITGATRGIGRSCAELFADHGWRVTAVARSTDDLAELAAVIGADTIVADLSTEAGVALVPVADYDVVLLNAAAYSPGPLLGTEDDIFARLYPLNVLGNHRLARRLLPNLIARDAGHLVVIGSTGTDNWKDHMTAYVATKYALRGLFLGWRAELARTRVPCTLVAPGATLTSSWVGEAPPGNILLPETVAGEVFRVVAERIEGRVTLP